MDGVTTGTEIYHQSTYTSDGRRDNELVYIVVTNALFGVMGFARPQVILHLEVTIRDFHWIRIKESIAHLGAMDIHKQMAKETTSLGDIIKSEEVVNMLLVGLLTNATTNRLDVLFRHVPVSQSSAICKISFHLDALRVRHP